MSTQLLERPRIDDGDIGEKEKHAWCHCNQRRTLCGLDRRVPPTARGDMNPTCVICDDLLNARCADCGCRLR